MYSSIKIKESFAQEYIPFEKMLKVFSESTQELDQDKPYYLEITNLKKLGAIILSGAKSIGEGQFGKVFKFPYQLNQVGTVFTLAAGKEIFFNNNYNTEQGEEQQDMIEEEINFNKVLDQFDPNGLYFPKYYGTYDVTKYFDSLSKTTSDKTIKSYLKGKSNQNILVLEMEFLDKEMYKFQRELSHGLTSIYFHTRCKIGESVLSGLLSFYSEYSHCDIKPENLMAKSLSEPEMERLAEFGVERIELYPGKFYQVKIIDFGLVAKGDSTTRRCIGGTPGFIPDEFFTKTTHKNFDVYSVAALMLDFEMSVIQFDDFSTIQDIFVTATRFGRGLTSKEKQTIQSISFYKMAKMYSSNLKYRAAFFTKLRTIFPDIDRIIAKNFQQKLPEDVNFETWVLGNPTLMKMTLLAAFETYMEKDFIQSRIKDFINDAETKRKNNVIILNTIKEETEEKRKLQEEVQFWENEKFILENTGPLQFELIMYCLDQLKAPGNSRATLAQFLETIQGLRTRFLETVGDKLNYNLKFKRYYKAKEDDQEIQRESSMSSYEVTEQKKRASFRLDDRYLIRI
jgi:serine/threonine protein kinase